MRPDRLVVPHPSDSSFDLRHERVPFFTNPWHFHPELELNYVIRSEGMRFIGHTVERFTGGEIVLLGANLPHYWKNDGLSNEPENPSPAEAIIARFSLNFLGDPFWTLPETQAIHQLLNQSAAGLSLREPLRSAIAAQLHRLFEMEGLTQLTAFLHLLDQIAHSGAVDVISPGYLSNARLTKQSERLSQVIGHLMQDVAAPVSLPVIADLAHMNPAAFCRYFKAQTGQTLTAYVTDLRIRYACELLLHSEESITGIGEKAGFEHVSYFVQSFRKQQGITPALYRKQFRQTS